MKRRIEVKLSLPVVAPLLEVIRELAENLKHTLAAAPALPDPDPEFREAWIGELLAGQEGDLKALLSLFHGEFFTEGVVAFDDGNAEQILRACAAIRLHLRQRRLSALGDEALETGEVEMADLEEGVRKAFVCYLFLATIQELIIQHLDSSIIGS